MLKRISKDDDKDGEITLKNTTLWSLSAMAIALTAASNAQAQSSVTLYGLIDAGVSYVNHSTVTGGSSKNIKYDDGVAQGSRWGIKGNEDLGDGLRALFVLENGFSSGTGIAGQGGAEFGRQAYVGLSKRDVGAVTFGRQYVFSTDFLSLYSNGGQTVAGNYGFHINDVDQLTSGRINNAVKFTSADFHGLTFGAMYGFSNQAGAFAGAPTTTTGGVTTTGSSRAYSLGANYKHGSFAIGAALTDIRYPGLASPTFSTTIANVATGGTKDLQTFGLGSSYQFGAATVYGLWTHTRFEPVSGAESKLNNFDLGGKYRFTHAATAALGYTFENLSGATHGNWHQVDASLDYALSARTDVYVLGIYQHASGRNGTTDVQAQIGSSTSYFGNSGLGTDSQIAARIGIRHKF